MGVDLPGDLTLGSRVFAPHELVIMAIINRTPDSFFDSGSTWADGQALDPALAAVDTARVRGHAVGPWGLGGGGGQSLWCWAAAVVETGRAGQDSGCVLHQGGEGVLQYAFPRASRGSITRSW